MNASQLVIPIDKDLDVFGWMADQTACGTLRIRQPLTALAQAGIRTDFAGDLRRLPRTLVGQRVCKDAPSRFWCTLAGQKQCPKLVFEIDDDLWNIDPSNKTPYRWYVQGIDANGERHNAGKNLSANIAAADAVTCTTEPLAELLKKFNPNVHIIPNYIPAWVLDWERPKRDRLTLGWGGSGTHSMDWEAEGPQIKRFLMRNPNLDFRLIGTGKGQAIGLPDNRVSAAGWIPSVEEYWKTIDFDIGVIPLKPHVFNQSKSALKFLENAALGIPTVASDTGPYARTIKHGETGFLVRQAHEWGKYLRMLIEDEAARQEIGANAKAWARTQVLENHLDEWKAVLL